MTTKFQQSWQLFKASITVTLQHRKLLLFPVLSTCLTALIGLFFLAPMALPVILHPTGYHLDQKQHWEALREHYFPFPSDAAHHAGPGAPANPISAMTPPRFPWTHHVSPLISFDLAVIYFGSMFLATFFNVAFYGEIMAALNGQDVSFRRGLALAWSRLPSILAWSMLAGAVGWLIRKIEEQLPFAGRIMMGIVGMAWSVASVFVIPIIIQQQAQHNPIKMLQQSAQTLKRTWGESLIGYVGFSAGNLVIIGFSLLPLLLAGALAIPLKSGWLIAIAAALWVLSLFALGYLSGVARHIYRCALYIYAAEGVVPGPYNREMLDQAWKVKKS